MRRHDSDINAPLPLPAAVFHILVALADRDRHGYGIMRPHLFRRKGRK
jgi:hypothetical protein